MRADATHDWAVKRDFVEMATKPFIGGAGGNPKGRYWVVGIEWSIQQGGEIREPMLRMKPYCFTDEHGEDVPCWSQRYKEVYPDYDKAKFDQIVAKLMHRVTEKGSTWKEYMQKYLYDPDGDCFNLNLYPLAAHDTKEEGWTEEHKKFSGLPTRTLYRAWCATHRFPRMKQIVGIGKYNPEVIVCAGTTLRPDFLLAFGEPSEIWHGQRKWGDGEHGIEELTVNGGRSKLFLCPFLGSGRYGIKANEEVNELAELLHEAAR